MSAAPAKREDPALSSFQTAIAVIPAPYLHPQINSLRSLYDKSYKKWPAHINVLYPFVAPEVLDSAVRKIRDMLEGGEHGNGFTLELDSPGNFRHRQNATVYLSPGPHGRGTVEHPETPSGASLRALEGFLASAFGKEFRLAPGDGEYQPHLTIGQTSLDSVAMDSLMSKAAKLGGGRMSWFVSRLAVLKRDEDGDMKIVDEILLGGGSGAEIDNEAVEGITELDLTSKEFSEGQSSTYRYSVEAEDWIMIDCSNIGSSASQQSKEITIATYNCLIDSPFPPPLERYPLLLNAILSIHPMSPSSALPSLLCLQEVTDEFLPYLLSNEHIQSRYPFCTHSPDSVFPSIRNCIILASQACGPFEWEWVGFTKRHKGAVVASFPRLGSVENPLVVSVVHLTCGLTDGSVAAKMSQLRTLTAHLQKWWAGSEWVVAGDFNLPTSEQTIATALRNQGITKETYEMVKGGLIDSDIFSDTWELCFGENEEDDTPYEAEEISGATQKDGEWGATFNPLTNPLAADRVQWSSDPRPQRYDRILIRRSGRIGVRDVRRFGFPEKGGVDTGPACGSDHWGLKAVLNIHSDIKGSEAGQGAVKKLELLPVSIDDQALKKYVQESMPSKEDHQAREAAIKTLKETLEQERATDIENIPSRAAFPILLVPVGSYMLDVYDKNSDVDCLCLSTISIKTFFQVSRQRIKKFGGERGVRVVRFVDSKVPMLELKIRGIRMDLQYCQAPNLVEYWADVPLLPPDSFMFGLPASTLKKLNAYRDAEYLLRTLPNLKVFRLAHRFIRLWTKTSGISSSRFGYLGGFHVTLLLARVCKLADEDPKELTAAKIVMLFFNYYAQFDWASDIVSDPAPPVNSRYHRFSREAMVLATIYAPSINVAQTATRHSVKALSREFKVANEALKNGRWDLKSLAREDGFLKEYQSFIKIDVQYWGTSADLNSRVPSIHARVWPQRFTNIEAAEEWTELRGFYLVGLSNDEPQSSTDRTDAQKAKDHKREIENKFLDVIRSFEELLRGNASHYDATDSWIQVQHVGQSALGTSPELDDRDWDGEGGIEEYADDIDDNNDTLLSEDDGRYDEDEYVSSRNDKKKSPKKAPVSIPGGKKLRPAADVISRIRWDPSLDARDFLIGYEDRFLGTRETEIDKWKTEQTDLEFIPMHRVIYFKRKSDGVLVWDRETKKDLLFGSGGFGDESMVPC